MAGICHVQSVYKLKILATLAEKGKQALPRERERDSTSSVVQYLPLSTITKE